MKDLTQQQVTAVQGAGVGAVGSCAVGARIGAMWGPWAALGGCAIGVGLYYLP